MFLKTLKHYKYSLLFTALEGCSRLAAISSLASWIEAVSSCKLRTYSTSCSSRRCSSLTKQTCPSRVNPPLWLLGRGISVAMATDSVRGELRDCAISMMHSTRARMKLSLATVSLCSFC